MLDFLLIECTLILSWPGVCAVILVTDVVKRVRRLEDLTRGLSREVALWKEGTDPLLYLERRAYLNAILDALAGVEAARVVLARASQRLQDEEQREQSGEQGEAPAEAVAHGVPEQQAG
jgi:hypothetical protein